MEDKNGFIVYPEELKPIADKMTDEALGELFRAMIAYQLDGTEPEFSTDALEFVFIMIRQRMDWNNDKYAKKCARNKANAEKRWNKNGMQSDATACDGMQSDANGCITKLNKNKTKLNKNKNKTKINAAPEDAAGSGKPDARTVSLLAVSRLNELTGRRYQGGNKSTIEAVNLILSRGYSAEDILTVIDRKCAEWSNSDRMRQYLRPSTLLNPDKFDEYLNAPETIEEQTAAERDRRREKARTDLLQLEAEYSDVMDAYNAEPDIKRRIDMRGKIEVLRAQIDAAKTVIS